ncbi:MAG: hypothetical protein QHH14_01035 [Clostridiales bacterium]|nr:hypothetical protein [Clostridiales bacterium]
MRNKFRQRMSNWVEKIIPLGFLIFLGTVSLGAETIRLRVTAEQANIREKPDITSAILLQVQEGSLLEAERKEGEWYAVRVEQEGGVFVAGYVHESLVSVLEPPKPQEKAVPVLEKPAPEKPVQEKPEKIKKPQIIRPAPAVPPPQPEPRREHFSLCFWWGARYAQVGDLNAGADGLASYYAATLGAAAAGSVKALRLGYVAGGELRLPLGSGFYFAAGAEYYSNEASSTVSFGSAATQKFLTTPGVQALPVSLSILFFPVRFLNMRAGLEYSFVRCSYLYRLEKSDFWQKWKGQATSGNLGYHFGIGIDWRIFSHVSLVTDALYRRSTIKGFEGDGIYQESAGAEANIKGKLYFFQQATTGDQSVPLVFLREKAPTEPGVSDVREAELDLTGLSLRAGLKITF